MKKNNSLLTEKDAWVRRSSVRRFRCLTVGLVLGLVLLSACGTGSAPGSMATVIATTAVPLVQTSLPEETPTHISVSPNPIEVTVYFTDSARYAAGTPPFEAPVTRMVPGTANPPDAVLTEFFVGPTLDERTLGLEAITSGFTGYSSLQIQDGVARVFLAGTCASNGATYTVAQPILANLLQFPEIQFVKIYDEYGTTEQPDGPVNSIPFCLEP